MSKENRWLKTKMKDIYLGFWDGPHATPKPSDTGPVFLGIKNITEDGRLDLSTIRHISEADYPKWTRRVEPQPGDIVFTYEATLNRYAIIPNGFRGCLGRRLALIRPDKSKVDTQFLFYYFFGEEWRNTILNKVILGSTVDRIPLLEFPNFELNLPPLPTQRKIAAILSAYDDLIEKNTRRIQILEEMAQALYRHWFVDFKFPEHEHVRLVDSGTELGLVPEGWEVKSVGDVLDYYIGGGWGKVEVDENNTFPAYVIRGTDIPGARKGVIDNVPLRIHNLSNFQKRQIFADDIIFEVSGGSVGQPVGRALYVGQELVDRFEKPIICASFCKLIRVNKNVLLPEILFQHFLEIYENGVIEKYQVQSTGIKNFKFTYFLEAECVVVPPISLQARFGEYTNNIYRLIGILGTKNANLRSTRNLLLPKLISGELDVSDLEIQEE